MVLAAVVGGVVGSAQPPAQATLGSPDTVTLFDTATGRWHARLADGSTTSFFYGNPGDLPLLGDWDGDGVDTVGMYRPGTGFVYLRDTNSTANAELAFHYGQAGDVPLVGDWNADGRDTLAIYRQSEGRVYVSNQLGTAPAEFSFYFGIPGDRPFAGNFDGLGGDSIGLYRESSGFAYFRNSLTIGVADLEFYYGEPADRILAGDWDGNGTDTVGIFRPREGKFYLSNQNAQKTADISFFYGAGNWLPAAGRTAAGLASAARYRINAGGPGLEGAPPWTIDAGVVTGTTSVQVGLTQPVNLGGLAVPARLFDDYRFGPMRWAFPVTPGRYEVRLYFAETFPSAQAAGARIFDVSAEGVVYLSHYDIFAEVGGFRATVKRLQVFSDGVLNLDFGAVVNSPAVHAIEIISLGGGGLGASPASLDFGSVGVGDTALRPFTLVNNGSSALTITGVGLEGLDATRFSVSPNPAGLVLGAGAALNLQVGYTPNAASTHAAELVVTSTAGTLRVPLAGSASLRTIYRVNAGGPVLGGALAWNTDAGLVTGANEAYANPVAVDVSAVPGVPETLFQTQRFGGMEWNFPIANPGSYEVRLYFAEIFPATGVGVRVFDVRIEGSLSLASFDLVAAAGGVQRGIVRRFPVTIIDGNLDVDFTPILNNPAVQGIEIVRNQPPGLSNPGLQSSSEGQVVGLTVVGSDPDGDTVTFAASGLPPGLAIDPQAGVVSGALGFATAGVYSVTITANDGQGQTNSVVSVAFTWTVSDVNRPPTVTAVANQNHNEGTAPSLQVAAADPDGDPLSYVANGLPPNLSIGATGLIAGTLSFESSATHSVSITVSDGSGGSTTVAFSWTVVNVNRNPTVTPVGPQTSQDGFLIVPLDINASDPDVGDTITYTAAGLPTGLSINSTTGLITGTPTTAGIYTVTVTATDQLGGFGTATFSWTIGSNPIITNAGAIFPVDENLAGGTAVGTVLATDPDLSPQPLSYSIVAGAGGFFSIDAATGVISTTGPLDFETNPSFALSVRVTDGIGEDVGPFTITVTNLNEPPVITNAGAGFSVAENLPPGTAVGTVTATDPEATAPSFSIIGGSGSGLFAIGPSSGAITTTATFDFETAPPAGYSLTVQATDGVNPVSAAFTVTVTNVNEAPTAVITAPATGTAGAPVAFDASASTDPEGPIATYAWDFGDTTTAAGAAPTHIFALAGTYLVVLTVTDAGNLPAATNHTIVIS